MGREVMVRPALGARVYKKDQAERNIAVTGV